MKILAIESSCDETAFALLFSKGQSFSLLKNSVYSQVNIHKKYGGVIPEIAARKHLETLIPLLDSVLGKNKLKDIDYLATTAGPGLITSLLLGMTAAKTLAYSNDLPLLPINHLEGHIYSNWLAHSELVKNSAKYFPALVLIVSGGHTELILMKGHGKYQSLGETLDDAVGEAFDKVAKLLSLGYPGGPIISKIAEKGYALAYDFPRPMMHSNNFDFSLSGLKTAILYTLEKKKKINKKDVADVAASFQQAVTDVLADKTFKAARKYKVKSIMLAGGVSANKFIRREFKRRAKALSLPFFYPDLKFTGDNAAMIAVAAYYQIKNKAKPLIGKNILILQPKANWQLTKNRI